MNSRLPIWWIPLQKHRTHRHLITLPNRLTRSMRKTRKSRTGLANWSPSQKNHLYSSEEFDRTKELLKSFGQSFDTMGVEQKRIALRAFIRRIVWDGKNVHVVLFGDSESEIDYTDLAEEKAEPNRGDSE